MSGYRPGHEQGHNPYIDYSSHTDGNTDERVYVTQVSNSRHGSSQGLNTIGNSPIGGHQHQHQPSAQHSQPHAVYSEHELAHSSPQYSSTSSMIFGHARRMQAPSVPPPLPLPPPPPPPPPPQQQQTPSGTKRQRPEDLELEMSNMPGQQIHQSNIQSIHRQMGQQSIVYGGQTVQAYHTHPLPNQSHRSKMPRLSEDDAMNISSAPSVVGMEGMPAPAPRPRGPKLKFTPEDDALLVDLKENKSLTWKQIADFFPGRSSGTLQVRYCTKLKAKTTQWTEETIQKLRTALHDYEQEKWRIIAQKVGTGFTSTACKEKAEEL
ncbi:putative myb dna-binding domain-containing protein [Erysiphe necator]|uniref:Putative myb dna-binding domain-containing protein n=1 Tax=Uncinula necator TaxID=52586 RepID=A0A0B1P325_UNCNE|nr:putative myb dna-binding domain-containing protein [Erysiphe necator]